MTVMVVSMVLQSIGNIYICSSQFTCLISCFHCLDPATVMSAL